MPITLPKKILVPVDFSDSSKAALDYAVQLAVTCKASVVVMHVVELPAHTVPDVIVESPGQNRQRLSEYLMSTADGELQKLLQTLAPQAKIDQVPITHALELGTTTENILNYAANNACDLIVIGTHGRSGLQHLLLGSTAEKIVRKATCPVLTIRGR